MWLLSSCISPLVSQMSNVRAASLLLALRTSHFAFRTMYGQKPMIEAARLLVSVYTKRCGRFANLEPEHMTSPGCGDLPKKAVVDPYAVDLASLRPCARSFPYRCRSYMSFSTLNHERNLPLQLSITIVSDKHSSRTVDLPWSIEIVRIPHRTDGDFTVESAYHLVAIPRNYPRRWCNIQMQMTAEVRRCDCGIQLL